MNYIKWLCKFLFDGKEFNLAVQGGLRPELVYLCKNNSVDTPVILVTKRFMELPKDQQEALLIHVTGYAATRNTIYADHRAAMFVGSEKLLDIFDKLGTNNTIRKLHIKNLNMPGKAIPFEVIETCEGKPDAYGYIHLLIGKGADSSALKLANSFYDMINICKNESLAYNRVLADLYMQSYSTPKIELYSTSSYNVMVVYKNRPHQLNFREDSKIVIFVEPNSSLVDIAENINYLVEEEVQVDEFQRIDDIRLEDPFYRFLLIYELDNLYDKAKSLGIKYADELDKLL